MLSVLLLFPLVFVRENQLTDLLNEVSFTKQIKVPKMYQIDRLSKLFSVEACSLILHFAVRVSVLFHVHQSGICLATIFPASPFL